MSEGHRYFKDGVSLRLQCQANKVCAFFKQEIPILYGTSIPEDTKVWDDLSSEMKSQICS